MKKAFIIKIKDRPDIAFFFRFFENGFIESYHYQTPGVPPEPAQSFLQQNFPFHIEGMAKFKVSTFIVEPVIPDLSFNKFWDTYAHKQGKKARAERLWKQLSETERASAMAYIKKYDAFLWQNKGIAKAYPETYLNQKRWENE